MLKYQPILIGTQWTRQSRRIQRMQIAANSGSQSKRTNSFESISAMTRSWQHSSMHKLQKILVDLILITWNGCDSTVSLHKSRTSQFPSRAKSRRLTTPQPQEGGLVSLVARRWFSTTSWMAAQQLKQQLQSLLLSFQTKWTLRRLRADTGAYTTSIEWYPLVMSK